MGTTSTPRGARADPFSLVSPWDTPEDRTVMDHERGANSETTLEMLKQAVAGDATGWERLLGRYHDRLRRMIAVRLHPRLQGRFDPSDVLQETYVDALARLPEYLREARMPFFLWIRYLTAHRLGRIHRAHLGRRVRDAGREVSIYRGAMPEASSAALAAQLLGKECRPSEVLLHAERQLLLQEALNRMDPIDREVLSLRHFERLTRAEAAQVLNISGAATAKRYFRALERLRQILALLPGGLEDFR
jgi:RNA polymerase sigma-70 factor (ECF subfamily)